MPRLTEGQAFRELIELTGLKMAAGSQICCVCSGPLSIDNYEIKVVFPRFELSFHVCRAYCAYELGLRTAGAIEVLTRQPVCAVPSGDVRVRGHGRRAARTSGTGTAKRRKNGTPAPNRPKTRG